MIQQLTVLIVLFLAFPPLTGSVEKGRQDAKGAPATQGAIADPVVVKVLGESITEKQVLDTINQLMIQLANKQQATEQQLQQKNTLFYRDALDTLIGTILLKNEAKEKNLVADKAKVEETLRSMKGQFQNETQFQQALQTQGLKEADLRNSIETNILCQQVLDLVAQDIPAPTDAAIQKFYDENSQSFQEPEQMRAANLFLKVDKNATPEQKAEIRKKLEAIRADIENHKITFAEAAIKESDDKTTGPKGGDLGFFKRGAMLKPLEDAAFATRPGTLTPILETDIGYQLINVIELKPAGKIPLEAAKPKIKDFLARQGRQEATKKHLADLKTKAKIDTIMSDEEWNKRHAVK